MLSFFFKNPDTVREDHAWALAEIVTNKAKILLLILQPYVCAVNNVGKSPT